MATQTLNSQLKALVQEIENAKTRNLSEYHSTEFDGYRYAANAYNAVLLFLAPIIKNMEALSNADALPDEVKAEALKAYFLDLEQEFKDTASLFEPEDVFAFKTLSRSFKSKSGLYLRIQVQNEPFGDEDVFGGDDDEI